MTLEDEVIHALRRLGENDRDLRTITILCNPRHIRGADKDVKKNVLAILIKLEEKGRIVKKEKFIQYDIGNKRKYILYTYK